MSQLLFICSPLVCCSCYTVCLHTSHWTWGLALGEWLSSTHWGHV